MYFRVGSSKQDHHSVASESSSSKQEGKYHYNSTSQNERQNGKVHQQRVGTGRIVKPKKEIKDSDYKGFTKSRQYKSSKTEQKVLPRRSAKPESDYIQSQNYTNKNNTQDVEADLAKLSLQDAGHKNSGKHGGQRQASVPPRLQAEQKASKRYSSLRQRSLPETAAPPFNQHQSNFYGNGNLISVLSFVILMGFIHDFLITTCIQQCFKKCMTLNGLYAVSRCHLLKY